MQSNEEIPVRLLMSLADPPPHPEVAAKRPSKGLLQRVRSVLMDASGLPRLRAGVAPQHEGSWLLPELRRTERSGVFLCALAEPGQRIMGGGKH